VRGVLRVDSRGDTLGLWANLSLDSLSLDGLRSSYPVLRVRGALGGDLKLAGYLDSLALSARLAGPAGRGTAEGALLFLGPRRGFRWLDASFANLDLHRLNDTLPRTALDGRLQGGAVLDSTTAPQASGQLALAKSSVAGSPLDSLFGRFTLADSVFRVETLSVYAPGLIATARGGLGLGGSKEDSLRVLTRSDSVGVVAPLARWLASVTEAPDSAPTGAAEAEVDLTGSFTRFGLVARGRTPALRWGALTLRGGTVTGRWQSQERGVVELDAEADSLSWNGWREAAAEARVRGRRDSLGWFARSRWGESGAWLAGGTLRADSAVTRLVIDSLGVLLPSEAWFLTPGTRVAIQDSTVEMDSTAVTSASGGGRLTLGGRLPRLGQGDFRVSLERVPLTDAWALAQRDPGEVAGSISGTMALSGGARDPLVEGKLALQDAAFSGFHAPYVDGTFKYDARRLGGEFALWRNGQRVLGITGDLPLDLALRDAPPDRKLPGPLSIRVRADSVDLGFLEAMVPVVRETTGRLSADFGIAGTWRQPELTGTVAVRGAGATLPALGVRYDDMFGRLALSGDTIRMDTLSLRSGEGTATIGGFVRLAELTRPILDLRISARDFRMMAVRDYLDFGASGQVALRGPFYGARLTGRGTVPRGVLYFTDLITKQVMNLEDVRYADIIDTSLVRRQGLREEFQNRFLDSLRIDSLSLTMGSDVWLRSAEANIQLSGGLVVNKVADRYRLDGTLETPRGTYRLPLTAAVRSDFAVTRGQLQYFGTADLNAAVDIDARHVVRQPDQNVNVDVHIGGTLWTPSLTLSSDIRPPISQSEIISYLLFGTSSYQAVGANARNAQVITSTVVSRWLAAQVSGQVERSLITDLGVPLDFVQIRPGDVNIARGSFLSGTEIAVGKQITVLGLPAYLTPSLRICQQQSWSDLGFNAELRLSRPWRLALSRDPVGPCTGLLGPSGSITRNQLGLDLFWDRIY
jgi:translocation and assembly module TamB